MVTWVNKYGWVIWYGISDPLAHDPLTDE